MELNREHFREIIFYNFRSGLTQQQCIDELNSIFGNEAPPRTSVNWWYGEFNRSRSSLQDEFREGRPKSVLFAETIDDMLTLQHRHVIYREIETTLDISEIQWMYIQYCMNFWLSEKFVRVGFHTICQSLKKGSCRLVERNAPKIRSRCFETRLWARK